MSEKIIFKASYDVDVLGQIRDNNLGFLKILTSTMDPPEFNERFYDICGEAVSELGPLLWFDRDRDGRRSLSKLYGPLLNR